MLDGADGADRVDEAVGAREAIEAAMPSERARLVRLCTRLTGDPEAAEDLAQEALIEGWKSAHTLRDHAKRPQWLAGIARNLCRNWLRTRGGAPTRLDLDSDRVGVGAADAFDLEEELEREELARLLDRALGLLPPETRDVLAARYLGQASYAEIAERLGVSVDAVSMRLTRGKRVLRRALATELRDEAAAFGLRDGPSDDWRETRIWCPKCGEARLLARVPPAPGTIAFRCPICQPTVDRTGWEYPLANASFARLVGDLSRPRAILNRAALWVHDYYAQAFATQEVVCTNCGRPARWQRFQPGDFPMRDAETHGVFVGCEACGECVTSSSGGLMTALPPVRAFWREHRRIRTLPEWTVEATGQPALVTRFEAVGGAARLDVVSLRDSLRVVGVYDRSGQPLEPWCSRS